MKRFFVCAVLALLTACATAPETRMLSSNSRISVAKLFTNDGCTVYRFSDAGYYIYYADCNDPLASPSHYSNGKTTQTFYPDAMTVVR